MPNPKMSPIYVMAERYQIEPDRLCDVLRRTIIKDTAKHQVTNEELAAFIIVANEYRLNPFMRQIHAFASQQGIVPIVAVDGWATLVNRQPEFDGCEFDERQTEDGTPLCTTCAMHVKGRQHAVRVTEWFVECKRPTIPWQTMPRRMLRHKAFIQAARLCFGYSGIYDEDEGRDVARGVAQLPATGITNLRQSRSAQATTSPTQSRMHNEEIPAREVPCEEIYGLSHRAPIGSEEVPRDEDELIPLGAIKDDAASAPSAWATSLAAQIDDEIDGTRNETILAALLKDVEKNRAGLREEHARLVSKIESKIKSLSLLHVLESHKRQRQPGDEPEESL